VVRYFCQPREIVERRFRSSQTETAVTIPTISVATEHAIVPLSCVQVLGCELLFFVSVILSFVGDVGRPYACRIFEVFL
jgi:hypothetical protein